jgi:hypothetical protein
MRHSECMHQVAHDGRPAVFRGAVPPAISRHETLVDLLAQSKRDFVPIRVTFVQQGKGKETKAGPLASFVARHDERALDAYLFVHAVASARPWSCDYPMSMWVRALGLGESAERASAHAAASKIMRRLVDRHLITRDRVGRTSSITLLDEDGRGGRYTHPAETQEPYLQLSHRYWHDRHYETLSLPAKAILLIALSLRQGFPLPYERGPSWYGISADSTERGLRDLERAGLLSFDQVWIKNHHAPTGWIERRLYSVDASFLPKRRSRRQAVKRPAAAKAGDTVASKTSKRLGARRTAKP